MTGALAGGLARRSIGRLDDTCWAGEVCLAKMGLEDLQSVKPGPPGASATRPLNGPQAEFGAAQCEVALVPFSDFASGITGMERPWPRSVPRRPGPPFRPFAGQWGSRCSPKPQRIYVVDSRSQLADNPPPSQAISSPFGDGILDPPGTLRQQPVRRF